MLWTMCCRLICVIIRAASCHDVIELSPYAVESSPFCVTLLCMADSVNEECLKF